MTSLNIFQVYLRKIFPKGIVCFPQKGIDVVTPLARDIQEYVEEEESRILSYVCIFPIVRISYLRDPFFPHQCSEFSILLTLQLLQKAWLSIPNLMFSAAGGDKELLN